jgi:hypothetical protein
LTNGGDLKMEKESDPASRNSAARKREEAYRTANRHLTSAGIVLALAGVRPRAPEMEALRRALQAVNLAGGLEKPRKEAVRAFLPNGSRYPKTAG